MPNLRIAGLVALALAFAACGTPTVMVIGVAPSACAFNQRKTCQFGFVQVETELDAGTELSRPECDSLCLPVNCAGESKKCSIQTDANGPVVLCEPVGC